MKKLPKGVYVEGNSVGIDFRFKGERFHECLKPNGVSLSATSPNIKYAADYRNKILTAIAGEKMGGAKFDLIQWLPHSKRIARKRHTQANGTIKTILTAWLDFKKSRKAKTTMRDYERYSTEFIERWGDLAPADLTVAMIKEWIVDSQNNGRSLKTIHNMTIPLRGALDEAEENSQIEFNPVDKIKWKNIGPTEAERAKNKEKIIYPFDFEEITAILQHSVPLVRHMLIFGFATGARINEIFGLGWEDIDLERGKLHFRYGRVMHHMTPLKNEESDRIIDLNEFPHVLNALRAQKALTFMLPAQDMGIYGGERHFVFYNPKTDKPFEDSDELTKSIWKPLLRKAGVRYRPPKQMRHTFATHNRVAGKPDLWIAKILGHTTTQMLEENYSKEWPSNAGKMGHGGEGLKQFWEKVA